MLEFVSNDDIGEIKENQLMNKKNLSIIIEESLKLVEEYREKSENDLMKNISNKNILLNNETIKFVQRPKTPIELIEKSTEISLSNLISNSILDKSDGFSLIISSKI